MTIEDRASLAKDKLGLEVKISGDQLEFEVSSLVSKLGLTKMDRKTLTSGISVYKSVRWDRIKRYLQVNYSPNYLTESQVKQIIQVSSRSINNDWLMVLNLTVHDIILSKEQECLSFIMNSFKDITTCEPEFTVGKYRVDLYMPEYNIVIECDEFDHDDRDYEYEKERERYIQMMLNSKIIRFNPDDTGFKISTIINRILKVIII